MAIIWLKNSFTISIHMWSGISILWDAYVNIVMLHLCNGVYFATTWDINNFISWMPRGWFHKVWLLCNFETLFASRFICFLYSTMTKPTVLPNSACVDCWCEVRNIVISRRKRQSNVLHFSISANPFSWVVNLILLRD